jgi:flagellar biosynthetic protein FliR
MGLEGWLTAHAQFFGLIFFRVTSLCLIAPIFGNRAVDARIKIGLGFFLTLVLMPLLMGADPPPLRPWSALPLLVVQECSVGFMIGLVSSLLFAATNLSGEILGRHMGFGLVTLLDPEQNDEASVVAQFENLVALMLFLVIGGHHLLLTALAGSFDVVPIGGVHCQSDLAMELVRVTGRIFPLAIKISAPAFVILIVTEVVVGIVARCVPQMNVLIVGLPLRIAVGLIGLAACVPMFSYIFGKMMRASYGDILTMLEHMH